MPLDQLDGPSAHLLRGPRVELSDLHVAGLSFHEGYHAGLAVAEHGIGLPVSDAGAVVGGGGSIFDGALSRQSSSTVVAAVALASLLGGSAQAPMEAASASLIHPDVSVDGFVTDLEPPLESQSPRDLLGAPVVHQQQLDLVPVLRREASISPRSRASSPGPTVCLLRPVGSIGAAAVAPNLPINRAPMPSQVPSDLRRRFLLT